MHNKPASSAEGGPSHVEHHQSTSRSECISCSPKSFSKSFEDVADPCSRESAGAETATQNVAQQLCVDESGKDMINPDSLVQLWCCACHTRHADLTADLCEPSDQQMLPCMLEAWEDQNKGCGKQS
jgi:hypothetical protein